MAKITFLGTGTSQGVPVISCECSVCSSEDPRDKRLRSSVMIEKNDSRIVIDAGPDFRQQMLAHSVRSIDGILITHEHKDHVGGLDDVRAFNYTMKKAVDIYATERVQKTIIKDFDYAFEEDKYPGVPDINLITIHPDRPFRIKDFNIVPVSGLHHRLPVLGFRVDNIGYITDFNYIDDREIEKLAGLEVLVVNALRRERHLSHFTLDQALELSSRVSPGRTYITHVSHQMGVFKNISKELPENVFFAYDNLVIETEEQKCPTYCL